MKKNPNHPLKGSVVRVDPIKRTADIQAMKELLQDQPRNYCLFVLGINTNLRVSTLLKITADMVRGLREGDRLVVRGKNGGKEGDAILNKASVEAISRLLASRDFDEGQGLFAGERGVLTVPSVNRLIKKWCRDISLRGNFGGLSLRKTFGYQQQKQYGVDLGVLMRLFRHATRRETKRYLSIKRENVRSIFENEI